MITKEQREVTEDYHRTVGLDIVVASHNEDLSWIERFTSRPGFRVFPYTTGKRNSITMSNGMDFPLDSLCNIAREASQFIHHIVENYGRFARHVAFVQGDPTFHCHDILDRLERPQTDSFSHLGHRDTLGLRSARHSMHDEWAIESMWDLFGCLFPVTWSHGAQFIVSREVLMSRPLEWYKEIYDWITENVDRSPWVAERLWRALVGDIKPATVSKFGAPLPVHTYTCFTESHLSLYEVLRMSADHVDYGPITVLNLPPITHAEAGEFEAPDWLINQQNKYELIVATLEAHQGEIVIWTDADIIFFADFKNEICQLMDGVDLLFQREGLFSHKVNCGFFAAKSNLEVIKLFRDVLAHAPFGPGRNDQHVMQELLDGGKCRARWGLLPPTFGAKSHGWPHPLLQRLNMYHATCTEGADSTQRKTNIMLEVVKSRIL